MILNKPAFLLKNLNYKPFKTPAYMDTEISHVQYLYNTLNPFDTFVLAKRRSALLRKGDDQYYKNDTPDMVKATEPIEEEIVKVHEAPSLQQEEPIENRTPSGAHSYSSTALPCCSMVQFNMTGDPTKETIWSRIKEHLSSEYGGRRVIASVVMIPGEERLFNTLKEIGFAEVAEFSRRHRYPQDVRLKMLLYEPETTLNNTLIKGEDGVVKNKIVLPNN